MQQGNLSLYQVPEAVQLAYPEICMAAVQQDGVALEFVPADVQRANSAISLAAMQHNRWSGAQGYVYTPPPISENDAKESKDFSLS